MGNARLDSGHRCMLSGAAVKGHCNLATILLQLGADVNAKNSLGVTPLSLAISMAIKSGNIKLTRLLLEWGGEITALLTKTFCIKKAYSEGNEELADLLQPELGGRRCEIINV